MLPSEKRKGADRLAPECSLLERAASSTERRALTSTRSVATSWRREAVFLWYEATWESDVNQVNLWGFYSIGGHVRQLRTLETETAIAQALPILENSVTALHYLLEEDMIKLEHSRIPAAQLLEVLEEFVESIKRLLQPPAQSTMSLLIPTTPDYSVGEYWNNRIHESLTLFENVFRTELNYVHAYEISDKGIFSTTKLMNSADEGLGDAKKRMSKLAISDAQAAGRCLALDLPTACGFHSLRALEAVIVDYIVRKTGAKPTKRDLGEYVRALNDNGADQDVTSTIDQLRRIQRNPLMHPEHELDEPTAIRVFQLCQSAMVACVADMEKQNLF